MNERPALSVFPAHRYPTKPNPEPRVDGNKPRLETPRRILPPFWMVVCLALAWALDRHAPLWAPEWPLLGLVGRGVTAVGAIMVLWPVAQFLAARTGIVPFTEARVLLTSGLYRFTRNPMYLGIALMQLGGGLVLGSLGALLPLPLLMLILQKRFIEGEERFLEDTFGDAYLAYRRRVRRWI